MSAPDPACPDFPNECVHPWAHARTYAEVKATQQPAADRPNLVPIYDAAERAMSDEKRRWTVPVPEELLLALSRAVVGTLRDASMLNYDRPWELDDRFADVLTEAGDIPKDQKER